jgi:hypothetical protein
MRSWCNLGSARKCRRPLLEVPVSLEGSAQAVQVLVTQLE